jgi:hypothetical protein
MAERRIDGFYYGLFMDSDILRQNQVEAVNPRRAYVDGYELRIGQRATLVPVAGARAYGMVISLTHDELEKLYTGPGLEEYRPEAILARILMGETVPALVYNLRKVPDSGESSADYATKLKSVLIKLEFPSEYVASVSS